MSKLQSRRLQGWIYKCSDDDPDHGYSWTDKGSFLDGTDQSVSKDFGGEKWIRSPQSWIHLANVLPGDLIFCHQGHGSFRALVGITVAASEGYPDPNGDHPDKCSTLDLGPERIAFGKPVTLAEIRASLNGEEMGAYVVGKGQATFHPVEEHLLVPLVELCKRKNPTQRGEIAHFTRLSSRSHGDSSADVAEDVIHDPIRREMVVEAFERKASWARLARRLFGYECMIPGCRFELIKDDGELYIEVHHIKAMCEGGSPNDKRNLSVLCPNHHRKIHYATTKRRKELTGLVKAEQARRLAALDD
jgi:hypothetical protein